MEPICSSSIGSLQTSLPYEEITESDWSTDRLHVETEDLEDDEDNVVVVSAAASLTTNKQQQFGEAKMESPRTLTGLLMDYSATTTKDMKKAGPLTDSLFLEKLANASPMQQ